MLSLLPAVEDAGAAAAERPPPIPYRSAHGILGRLLYISRENFRVFRFLDQFMVGGSFHREDQMVLLREADRILW